MKLSELKKCFLNRAIHLALILLTGFPFFTAQINYCDWGEEWRYYDLAMEPPLQFPDSIAWFEPDYVDSLWSVDTAQLGYGDGDEATVISDTTLTAYFRYSFHVSDSADLGAVELNLLYDDGAVVYLNGTEVWRVNMPAGPITYATFAAGSSGDNALESLTIPPTALVNGNNIIAVEVHQRSAGSSDLSFDFSLSAQVVGQISVLRGPYLQQGSPNSMVLKWRTSDLTQSIVEYGTSIDSLSSVVVDTVLKIDHEIFIVDLEPNTKYYYQISTQDTVLVPSENELYFKTSPQHGKPQKFYAWILGDPGTANNNARAVRDAYYSFIDTQHTDMILFLGDNAYTDGTDEEYQFAMFENMYEDKLRNSVSWSTLGNHDGHSADSDAQTGPYYEIFTLPKNAESGGMASGTEAYYSFDFANVHFIILDSYDSDRSVGGPMYSWCEIDLQNTTADWIVAFWHHPAYTKGSHDSDTEGRLIDMRENFLPLLEMYGTDVVLSGHSHSYERSYFINGHYDLSDSFNINTNTVGDNGDGDGRPASDGAYSKSYCQDEGAVYVTTGSAGKTSNGSLDHEAMFFSVKELGSCVMIVDSHTIEFKFLRENGLVQDSFSVIKVACDTTSTTVCVAISSGYGDVEQQPDSTIYQQSSDLELIRDDQVGDQVIGLVFEQLNIRRGSWIQSAYIQFTADDDVNDLSADSSYLIIHGHAVDDADLFDETLFSVSQRPVTNFRKTWSVEPWLTINERGPLQRSPDLSPIIQEIVNRDGYSKSSNIGFTISGTGKRAASSFEGGGLPLAPELCVTYANCQPLLQAYENADIVSYSAEQRVMSDDTFSTEGDIIFSAGDEIILEPNFNIDLGREFNAYIQGCKIR